MAMSAAVNNTGLAGKTLTRFDVIKVSNANKGSLVITHGLGVTPRKFTLVPLLAQAWASAWAVKQVSVNSTSFTLTAVSVTASGAAAAQLAVFIEAPHSIPQ